MDQHISNLKGHTETKAKDLYKGKIKKRELGVINMDDSDGPGTHFVAYFNSPDRDFVLYFDTYGVAPPENIKQYLLTSGKQIAYNNSQIQPIASVTCGFYCIYVLRELDKGREFVDVLNDFTHDTDENEQMIQRHFNLM